MNNIGRIRQQFSIYDGNWADVTHSNLWEEPLATKLEQKEILQDSNDEFINA